LDKKTCSKREWRRWIDDLVSSVAGSDASHLDEDSGVQSPAIIALEFPDGSVRVVFHGCRPHECGTANAYFLVDPKRRQVDVVWNGEAGLRYLGPNADLLKANKMYERLEQER
jgi:hypothetical protein